MSPLRGWSGVAFYFYLHIGFATQGLKAGFDEPITRRSKRRSSTTAQTVESFRSPRESREARAKRVTSGKKDTEYLWWRGPDILKFGIWSCGSDILVRQRSGALQLLGFHSD
jgi:hypothetical protein